MTKTDENKEFKTGEESFLEQACYIFLKRDKKPFYVIIGSHRYKLSLEKVKYCK